MIDKKKVAQAVEDLLLAIGEDPKRPGLAETPTRVAKMLVEVLDGSNYTNVQIAEKYDKCFEEPDAKDMVVVRDIEAFSFCEHHLALMYNMKVHVAYIPDGRVIGLSKIARIVDMVTKRLQLQERITTDVADVLKMILGTPDIMVVVQAEHSCMTTRGVKKPGTATASAVVRGLFKESPTTRSEAYTLMGLKG